MRTEETFDRISHAITRRPGKNFAEGICPAVGIPNYERALAQHKAYCDALEKCGVALTVLPADTQFPDACFISDMAIVTEYLAVIGSFADNSPRQGEQKDVASALAATKILKFVTAPGKLDCSDVLQIRDHFYIGLSDHTNQEGASQLAFFLKEYGYKVTMLDLSKEESVQRLNTAATYLGRDRILIRENLARHFSFLEYEKIAVPNKERSGSNAVMVNGTLIMPAGYSETLAAVGDAGIPVIEVNVSEFEKMNGGLGCLSLRLPKPTENRVIELPLRRKSAA